MQRYNAPWHSCVIFKLHAASSSLVPDNACSGVLCAVRPQRVQPMHQCTGPRAPQHPPSEGVGQVQLPNQCHVPVRLHPLPPAQAAADALVGLQCAPRAAGPEHASTAPPAHATSRQAAPLAGWEPGGPNDYRFVAKLCCCVRNQRSTHSASSSASPGCPPAPAAHAAGAAGVRGHGVRTNE
jgi:hypothetical protein